VLDTTRLKGFQIDPDSGLLTAHAGVTLGELLRALVPAGWMLPVVPGTQHVTVGGAIASDIHGKNHAMAGTFGRHVHALGLLTASGDVLELRPGADDGLFEATVGGMGLTGVILWARIQLRAVATPLLSVDTDRVAELDDALAVLSASGGPYRVAWLDLLGSRRGRGVVTRADHVDGIARDGLGRSGLSRLGVSRARPAGPDLSRPGRSRPGSSGAPNSTATVTARATIPAGWPGGLLRPSTVRAFNELRFRRAPRQERGHVESIGTHMFPLDVLDAWPRLYGRPGLVQYQLVVPPGQDHVLHDVIGRLRHARIPCFLAVLKDFGPANEAPLSFPIEGWTLALDVPRTAPDLYAALDACDQLVLEAGGRVYLSKDARLRPETVKAMYPRLDEWRVVREQADPGGLWQSDLARRTGLVPPEPRTTGLMPPEPRAMGLVPPEPRTAGLAPAVPQAGSDAAGVRTVAGPETRLLLVGGSSEIALAIGRRLALEGSVRPYLLGRDRTRLEQAAAALRRVGCAGVELDVVDADELAAHEQAVARAFERSGGFDVVVLAVGVLGAQRGLDADPDEAIEVMRVNFVGCGSLLLQCLRMLRDQGSGTLVVLSSVAAQRPRAANAIYGAAKAGLDALAQGLADATASSGVRVLVVRPGFVRTRMTAGLPAAPFATTPEAVADATARALKGRAHTIWVPPALRYVFATLDHVPRPIYRRLPL